MGIPLCKLQDKKLRVGMQKLANAGVSVERWLELCDATDAEMQRLMEAWPDHRPSFSYDAIHILSDYNLKCEPLPKPAPGEVVIRVGSWSLKDLCEFETVMKQRLMADLGYYKKYPFYRQKLTSGIYRLRMPIPSSCGWNYDQQCKLLLPGEEVAPIALAVAALLCHFKEAGKDLLHIDFARCAGTFLDGSHMALSANMNCGLVNDYADEDRYHFLWMVGARKIES